MELIIETRHIMALWLLASLWCLVWLHKPIEPKKAVQQSRRDFLKGVFAAGAAVSLLSVEDLTKEQQESPIRPDGIFSGDMFVTQIPEQLFFNGRLMRPGEEMDYQLVPVSEKTYRIDFEMKIKEGDMFGLIFFPDNQSRPVTIWLEADRNIYPRWQRKEA
jgi:hypothetical protein